MVEIVRKSTKENRGIKHYAFTVIIIICQQNVIFFGALSLRKGALKKKYFALDYYDLKNITKTVPLFQMS